MRPIQVIPTGLMGLLQLKQEGRLPDNLSETVSPVIEMRDWYLTSRRVDEQTLFGLSPTLSIATGNLGFRGYSPTAAVVPQSEIWYVEQMTTWVTMVGAAVATDLIRFACEIQTSTGGQIVGPDVSDYQLAARTRQAVAKADRGFWALPGDIFGIQVFDVVTTNGYLAHPFLRATRCPI